MNRILLLLVIWLPLLSCSNDDAEPDHTVKFVGSWKSEPVDEGLYISTNTWTIDKVSNDKVRIIIHSEAKSKDLSQFPGDEAEDVLDDISINPDGILIIDYRRTIDRVTYDVKGKGILKGNKLVVSATATNLSDSSTESYVEELTKL